MIAFLFLTREGLNAEKLWKDFFQDADPALYKIYAHTKHAPSPDSLLAPHRIANIVPTEWGSVSLVRATLSLLRAAYEDEANVKFVLLSESCVPLYSFHAIYRLLSSDPRPWMSVANTPPWMIHQKGPTREFIRWSKAIAAVVPSPESLLKQQQWMVFDRALAKLHLGTDHTPLWEPLFAPDEHYFVNVTVHELKKIHGVDDTAAAVKLLLGQVTNRKLTHVEWGYVGNGRAPLKLTDVPEELVHRARGEGCLFLRKVAPGATTDGLRRSWENAQPPHGGAAAAPTHPGGHGALGPSPGQ